ncbi:MAG: hypothetical protein QW756_05355 [Nitrososphaerota archaeon]
MSVEESLMRRIPLLAFGLLSLLLGFYGGLVRMGVLGWAPTHIIIYHGPLMVVGFMTTLIALERYVALKSWWSISAYMFLGAGGVLLAMDLVVFGQLLWVLGAVSFTASHVWLLAKFRHHHHIMMVSASLLLLLGSIKLYTGFPLYEAAVSWTGFLVLFIMGERVEMARVGGFRFPASMGIMASTLLFIASNLLGSSSNMLMALAMLALLISVANYDVGLRFLTRGWGFQRFLSTGLAMAYAWLAVGGLLWFLTGYSDPSLHSIFIGFSGTMIMTHAPVIIPSIIRTRHFYSQSLYIPLTLLQVSTASRIAGGLLPNSQLWTMSGVLTAISIAAYMAVMLYSLGVKTRR